MSSSIDFQQHDQCEALSSTLRLQTALLLQDTWVRRYSAGSFLWMAEDRPRHVFALRSGQVTITSCTSTGKEIVEEKIEAGQTFGYLCLCPHRKHPIGTQARAVVPSRVAVCSAQQMLTRVRQEPGFAITLIETMCRRTAEAEHRARTFSIRSAPQRLRELLSYLAYTRGRPGVSPDTFTLTMSQSEIAACAGLTRTHTSALLSRLRQQGCIAYERGSQITLNLSALEG